MFIVKATSDNVKAGAMTFRRAILDRTTFGRIETLSRTVKVQRHAILLSVVLLNVVAPTAL
jgi:hypothetical protein